MKESVKRLYKLSFLVLGVTVVASYLLIAWRLSSTGVPSPWVASLGVTAFLMAPSLFHAVALPPLGATLPNKQISIAYWLTYVVNLLISATLFLLATSPGGGYAYFYWFFVEFIVWIVFVVYAVNKFTTVSLEEEEKRAEAFLRSLTDNQGEE